jgi:hypothetical protein
MIIFSEIRSWRRRGFSMSVSNSHLRHVAGLISRSEAVDLWSCHALTVVGSGMQNTDMLRGAGARLHFLGKILPFREFGLCT